MASDLKVDIDGIRLNIRSGVIMRYGEQIVVEVSKVGRNSVIPGGRIQINEKSCDGIIREAKEEMGLELDKAKLNYLTTFENMFSCDGKGYHEIYFLYEYELSDKEKEHIENLSGNNDNETTYFTFINHNELESYNLLPLEIHKFIIK